VYDLLSRVPVPAHAAGEPSELFRPSPASGYPVLRHDSVTGDLVQVRWNNDDRSVMNALDPYLVEEWYVLLAAQVQSDVDWVIGTVQFGHGISSLRALILSIGCN
jgi:hypothetical protein